jgi:phosphate starvation-inducible protein PhoH and related proteins
MGRPILRHRRARPALRQSRSRGPLHAARLIRRHLLAPPDNRRLAHLCGPLETNLRGIEAALGVVLTRRDASLRIEGARAAVERTAALLDTLYAKAASPIGAQALQLALASAGVAAAEPGADVVLNTRHAELRGRTPRQSQYLRQMLAHDITFGVGPAGTGKTFLAVACAVDALERQSVQRIVLTRPAVEAGERLGFLPGDLAQKVDPYLRPLYDALYDLMGFDRVAKAFERGLIEIAPLAFMRGRTLNHAFVILDEAQNTTREQMKMFLTRIGFGSKCVVTGDVSQIDLPKALPSGLVDARRVLDGVPGIAFTDFTAADVVRHPLVARIVEAYEQQAAMPATAAPERALRRGRPGAGGEA